MQPQPSSRPLCSSAGTARGDSGKRDRRQPLPSVTHPLNVADARDDIIAFGGSPRSSGGGRDEAIESLFHAHYPRLVRTAFSLVADWALAEQLAAEAYLRLWR